MKCPFPMFVVNRLLMPRHAGQLTAGWVVACLLVACLPFGKDRPLNRQQQTPLFVPPTQAGAVSSEGPYSNTNSSSLASPNTDGNTQAPASLSTAVQCQDNLVFLKDITIPDGTSVVPDSTLDKRWEVENNGNCNWGKGYRIRLIAGPELGAQKEQALYPARSGSQANLRIVFKAPREPGTYRSAWQAFNPQGEPFGDPFFIDIKVEAP
jgi:hypothetical protein